MHAPGPRGIQQAVFTVAPIGVTAHLLDTLAPGTQSLSPELEAAPVAGAAAPRT